MSRLNRFSEHCIKRMRQRGKRRADIDLVLKAGSTVDGDGIILLKKDIEREISHRKQEIQALERLRNFKVVVSGGIIITCYDTTIKHQKTLLKGSRS